jgi:hypothetical protein
MITTYLSFFAADIGHTRKHVAKVITVPVATAEVYCSILNISKSPSFAEPSLTNIMKMMMKHKLDARMNKKLM